MIEDAHYWRHGLPAPSKVVPHPKTSVGKPVDLVVLHHSVTGVTPFKGTLAAIARGHMNSSYFDIAYNFLTNDVTMVEGRGGKVQGGATGEHKLTGINMDERSLSLCVLGNFEDKGTHEVKPGHIQTIAAGLVEMIQQGLLSPGFKIQPHSRFKATACCGKRLEAAIPAIMLAVNLAVAGVSPAPVVAPKPVTYTPEQKLSWIQQILEM